MNPEHLWFVDDEGHPRCVGACPPNTYQLATEGEIPVVHLGCEEVGEGFAVHSTYVVHTEENFERLLLEVWGLETRSNGAIFNEVLPVIYTNGVGKWFRVGSVQRFTTRFDALINYAIVRQKASTRDV